MTLTVDVDAQLGEFAVSCQFDAAPGSTTAIVGVSGAGKTTVLRAIAGLVRPLRGRIACDDVTWHDAASACWVPPHERDCAFVFADAAVFGHMSALDNVAFGLRARGDRAADAIHRAHQALELVGMAGLARRRAAALSLISSSAAG